MPRTITVKGVGRAALSPDLVRLSMTLETKNPDYSAAVSLAAEKIEQINATLERVGFEKKAVKTTSFDVHTDYSRVKVRDGEYKSVFSGFVCRQRLKVEFDFDTVRLAHTLFAISSCVARPELSIDFTVKDPSAVDKALLSSATENAREKAQTLCEAAGARLGTLLSIDYSWGELNLISHTEFDLDDGCMQKPCRSLAETEIVPDDIRVSDTATFVWELM